MRWVYLSPHLDDVVLSCGGLVWEQVQAGNTVEVWTICAGAPAPGEPISPFAELLHSRWGTGVQAVALRRVEDENALKCLGALPRYWDLPDCIYRRLDATPGDKDAIHWLVNREEDLWQPVHPREAGAVERLVRWLVDNLHPGDRLVGPLTLGNHVDHRLVRAGAERAARQAPVAQRWYADYPYAVKPGVDMMEKVEPGWRQVCEQVTPQGLRAWQEAIAQYRSQVSTFWSDRAEMDAALESYWQAGGGTCLWSPEGN